MKRKLAFIALLAWVSVVCCCDTFGQSATRIDASRVKNLRWSVTSLYNGIPSSGTYLIDFTVPTFSPAAVITIPANCSGSVIKGRAAATGSTTFTVAKNGSTICTGTVAAGATTATWTGTGSSTTITSSDQVTVQIVTADATYSGISATIAGSQQ